MLQCRGGTKRWTSRWRWRPKKLQETEAKIRGAMPRVSTKQLELKKSFRICKKTGQWQECDAIRAALREVAAAEVDKFRKAADDKIQRARERTRQQQEELRWHGLQRNKALMERSGAKTYRERRETSVRLRIAVDACSEQHKKGIKIHQGLLPEVGDMKHSARTFGARRQQSIWPADKLLLGDGLGRNHVFSLKEELRSKHNTWDMYHTDMELEAAEPYRKIDRGSSN
eukprot:TRINITY_DN7810_c0_g1_i2.p2 TRINITY_DN7810_c0_g1~~TRINITY_DN7810_c0_g1_i2.p2  ORF type:complete len:228 (-),score=53.53 TRINITY_DN7810_c0_g1_i2:261-944(-)